MVKLKPWAVEALKTTQKLAERNAVRPPSSKGQSFAWTSPYYGSRLSQGYMEAGGHPQSYLPVRGPLPSHISLLIMGNFIQHQAATRQAAIDAGLDVVHGEDGWFPHNATLHADPLGFCWESSLTVMKFKEISITQRTVAQANRQLDVARYSPPEVAHPRPYVLLPLQLLRDQVNVRGANLSSWEPVVARTLALVPPDHDVLVKMHPRDGLKPPAWLPRMLRDHPRLKLVMPSFSIQGLIRSAAGVIGVNSTVLYEARLIYNKPVWRFGESWFTGHDELFPKLELQGSDPLSHADRLGTAITDERQQDYADWFLYQLVARQQPMTMPASEPDAFIDWVHRRTYKAWVHYGESLFD